MKIVLRIILMFLLVGSTLLISCQKESIEIIEENDENAQAINSDLTGLLLRASMNEGDVDDFIMLGDCFTIAFPFTIIIDGIEIIVESEDDYSQIILIIEETGADIDDIEIVFPITLILSDYTVIVVNDLQELELVLAQCQGNYNRIDCVDFVYPITIFRYNENTENNDTIVIDNDEEFYLLLSNLEEGEYISIQYPISVIFLDGSVVEINSNEELEIILSECDDSIDESIIESYLITDTWYVGYFFNGEVNTTNYCEFVLTFSTDQSVMATNGGTNYYGEWNTIEIEGIYYLQFDFIEFPFDEFTGDWLIIEASLEIIGLEKLRNFNMVDVLLFSRVPSSDC
jgi:hypothetical protein